MFISVLSECEAWNDGNSIILFHSNNLPFPGKLITLEKYCWIILKIYELQTLIIVHKNIIVLKKYDTIEKLLLQFKHDCIYDSIKNK